MRFGTLDITAPGLFESPWNEAEVLGSAVWLWMHSSAHRDAPLHSLSALLLPALKHRQFILASEQGKPVFVRTWDWLIFGLTIAGAAVGVYWLATGYITL